MKNICAKKWRLAVLAGAFGCVTLAAAGQAATKASPLVVRGKETFEIYCMTCHGANGSGGFGPALTHIVKRKDKRPLGDIIRKPPASMPPLYPATLTDRDVAEVVAYLNSIQ